MRLFLFLPALLATLAFISCDKTTDTPTPDPTPTTGTLELVFKGRYNGAPLATYTNVATNQSDPTALLFKKLEFFIYGIQGQKEGTMIDLADVGYVSLTNLSTTTGAEEGVKITIEDVPVGMYDQLQYGVGLPDEINDKEPGDFESTSPLAAIGNYWANWNSYIFCKIEGEATTASGGSEGFLYHSGVNGMYQTRSFNKGFSIDGDKTTTVTFHLHGEELFFKAGQEIAILTDKTSHSGAQGTKEYQLAKQVLINLADALHVQ